MTLADPAFEALWKRVTDAWDDDAAHGALLEHCQRNDLLAEAAARYRGMTGDRERAESAQKRLQAVALLAMAKLEVQRSDTTREPSRAGSLILVAFFVTATIALLVWFGR